MTKERRSRIQAELFKLLKQRAEMLCEAPLQTKLESKQAEAAKRGAIDSEIEILNAVLHEKQVAGLLPAVVFNVTGGHFQFAKNALMEKIGFKEQTTQRTLTNVKNIFEYQREIGRTPYNYLILEYAQGALKFKLARYTVDEQEIELFTQLGPEEYLRQTNTINYMRLLDERARRSKELQQHRTVAQIGKELADRISKIDSTCSEFVKWFLGKGMAIPTIHDSTENLVVVPPGEARRTPQVDNGSEYSESGSVSSERGTSSARSRRSASDRSDAHEVYIDFTKRTKITRPTLEDLSSSTGISEPTWRRRFKDVIWVAELLRKLKQRQSGKFSKTEKSRRMWEEAELSVQDKMNDLGGQAQKRAIPYDDEKNASSAYDDN